MTMCVTIGMPTVKTFSKDLANVYPLIFNGFCRCGYKEFFPTSVSITHRNREKMYYFEENLYIGHPLNLICLGNFLENPLYSP